MIPVTYTVFTVYCKDSFINLINQLFSTCCIWIIRSVTTDSNSDASLNWEKNRKATGVKLTQSRIWWAAGGKVEKLEYLLYTLSCAVVTWYQRETWWHLDDKAGCDSELWAEWADSFSSEPHFRFALMWWRRGSSARSLSVLMRLQLFSV